jgi:hypothetical protein
MPGRPSKAVAAMKKKDYRDTVWELLLNEYRCAQTGKDIGRLGTGAVPALLKALADLDKGKPQTNEDEQMINEMAEWSKK